MERGYEKISMLTLVEPEVFKLAGLKREDGTSKLDDLVAAVTDPVDSEGAMRDWFMSLFRDKIPGREETYISELLVMKNRTEKSLVSMLDDDRWDVRANAVQAIGMIGDRSARASVEPLTDDPNSIVRQAADAALEKLR